MSGFRRSSTVLTSSLAGLALLGVGGCGLSSVGTPSPLDVAAYVNDQRTAFDAVKGLTPREYLTASIVYSNQRCKEFFIALAEADRQRQLAEKLLTAAGAAGASLFPVVSGSPRDLAIYTASIAAAAALNDGVNQIYGFAAYGNEIANKVTESQNVYLSAASTRDSIRIVSAYSTQELRGRISTSIAGSTFAPIPAVNLVINIDHVTRDEAFLLARYVAQGYAYQCSVANINTLVRSSIATARIGNHAGGGRGGFYQAVPGAMGGQTGTGGGTGSDNTDRGDLRPAGGRGGTPRNRDRDDDNMAVSPPPPPSPLPKPIAPGSKQAQPSELGALTAVENGLTSTQITTLQNNLCITAADGMLGSASSQTRAAIGNYQAATGQAQTGSIDTDAQLNEIRNSPSCILPRTERFAAFHKFYLASPQRRQTFYADLVAAMRYLGSAPLGLRQVSVPARMTESSLEGDVSAPQLTRQAIRLIEEARGTTSTGILAPQTLAAIREFGSKAPSGPTPPGDRPAPPTVDPLPPTPPPATVPLNTVESRLSSNDVNSLQRRLCVPPDGNRSFAPTLREAVRNYQSATGKTVTGSLDEAQVKEIRASPICVLRPGSAFAKFHLRTPQQRGQFLSDLAATMRALESSKPIIAQQKLTQIEKSYNDRTRQAIDVIQEHIGIAKTGHLDKRVLDAIKELASRRN